MSEVRRLAQQRRQRVPGRQRAERGDQLANPLVGGRDAEAPAELLQHVDAGPPVRRVDHEVHRAAGRQHVAQRREPRVRDRQVMQHARADDLIERRPELADLAEGELMDLEVVELVLPLERLGVRERWSR